MFRFLTILFLSIGFFSSCAPLVDVQFDEKVDFSKYQAYYFYPISSGLDEFEDAIVMQTLDSLLQERNFKNTRVADFLVNYYVVESRGSLEQLEADYYNSGITVQEFVLDFIDEEEDKLIWQGKITGKIMDGISDKQLQRYYERLLEELLKEYPPKK